MMAFLRKSKPETQQKHKRPTSHETAPSRASGFVDNRPEVIAQRTLQDQMDESPQVQRLAQLQAMLDNSPRQVAQRQQLQPMIGSAVQRQEGLDEDELQMQAESGTLQEKFATSETPTHTGCQENRTGMPDNLKAGIENLSGMSMDDVNVHYNSSKPAQLNALAYTQGTDIHVGPGQEQHLPHEGWHLVQQREGRVKPTVQAKGVAINDDEGLEHEADEMGTKALQMRRSEKSAFEFPIHGKDIHSAAGQYTEKNRKHELGNAIDNALNGTPKGDTFVNGQMVDTTREKAAGKIADAPLQRSIGTTSNAPQTTTAVGTPIQRKLTDANEIAKAKLGKTFDSTEDFPWDTAPKYLLRDRDVIYGSQFRRRVRSMGIKEVLTAPRSPWQNAFVERIIGSIRRDCLDHIIVLNDRHLKRILKSYFNYYHRWRTHLSLGMDSPESRPVQPPTLGGVIQFPEVGGLHHHYERLAA